MVKCQRCKRKEAIWAMQYIGEDTPTFTPLGSHYRGFKVTKLCDDCKGDYEPEYYNPCDVAYLGGDPSL